MDTLANVFADARLIYNDIPLPTDAVYGAQVLRLANKVHTDLSEEYVINSSTYDVPLVQGTREYAISETYKSVLAANYLTSATAAPIPLSETSRDELDIENPGWQSVFQGIPYRYYLYANSSSQPVVGFDPIPASTQVAGYPTVRLYVSVYSALVAGSTLPTSIRSSDVYVDGLAYLWAKHRNKPDVQARKQMYQESRNFLGVYLERKDRRLNPRAMPFIAGGASPV